MVKKLALAALLGGGTIGVGVVAAVPVAVYLTNNDSLKGQTETAALLTIEAEYGRALPAPAAPEGYQPAILESTNYDSGRSGNPPSAVGSSLNARFTFAPDPSLPGASALPVYANDYTVRVVRAGLASFSRNAARRHIFQNGLPQLKATEYPVLGEGYGSWSAEPVLLLLSNNRPVDPSEIPSLGVGTVFSAIYQASAQSNYAGNPASFTVSYTVFPASTGTFDNRTEYATIPYGLTALPAAPYPLPTLPQGYDAWSVAPRYTDSSNQTVTDQTLAGLPAGSELKASWTANPAAGNQGTPAVYTVVFAILKKAAASAVTGDPIVNTTTMKAGDIAAPAPTPPRLATGYVRWDGPQTLFFNDEGDPTADFFPVKINARAQITYTAAPDQNYDVAPYSVTYVFYARS